MWWLRFFKVRRKRKVIGHMTTFPILEIYRKLCDGEITVDEYRKANVEPMVKPIYEDEIK